MDGRRDRVEALLSTEELVTIAQLCEVANVPFGRWVDCPPIARPWLLLAVERLAQRLEAECGGITAARMSAAIRLGVEPETLRTWRRRWRKAAYSKGSKCTPHSRAAGVDSERRHDSPDHEAA